MTEDGTSAALAADPGAPQSTGSGANAHAWAGFATAALITFPTTPMELAIIPAFIASAIRWKQSAEAIAPLWNRPIPLLAIAFSAWLAIGLLWTPDLDLGLEEVIAPRFLLAIPVLAPILRTHRLRLVAGLIAGLLIGHVVQVGNAWTMLGDGPEWLGFKRLPSRISGWWDPAVSGTVLTAAIGLHLPAATMGRGRTRLFAAACLVVTFVGLIATGARGGWVASAALTAIVVTVALCRKSSRVSGAVLAGIAIAGVAGALVALRGPLTTRFDEARDALTRVQSGDFNSDTGARLAMKLWALDALKERPITGVGSGGFAQWTREHAENFEPTGRYHPQMIEHRLHDHAHDTVAHAMATGGLIGLAIVSGLGIAGVVQGLRWTRGHSLGSYHAAPACAMLGLVLATPFDSLQASASATGITGMMLALNATPPKRSGRAESDDERATDEEPAE